MGLFNFLLGLTGVSEPKPGRVTRTITRTITRRVTRTVTRRDPDACGCPECDPNTRVISECIRYPKSDILADPTAHFDSFANANTLPNLDGHTVTVALPNLNGLSFTLTVSDAYNRGYSIPLYCAECDPSAKHHAKRLAKHKRRATYAATYGYSHAERNADTDADTDTDGDPWPKPSL